MRNSDFPEYADISEALLCLIVVRGGPDHSLRPRDCYSALADAFGLTLEQRTRLRPEGRGGSAWQNCVQWARQRLINEGAIDGRQHGLWRVTASGRRRAEKSRYLQLF